jgi:DNA topoisomerase-1
MFDVIGALAAIRSSMLRAPRTGSNSVGGLGTTKQLIHNGILFPKYEPRGFKIAVQGKPVVLSPQQEEMALAWVRKLGTEYVEDRVFVRNFFGDFCSALGVSNKLGPDDFDFSEIVKYVEDDRAKKLVMGKDEKKRLAAERKAMREANKVNYGQAVVDGEKVDLGNYMAEPSCIFMGRGKHPLRGKWKQGPSEHDVILNLSRDAPRPLGNWKEIVWQPDSMWVAKWDDRLRGEEKYIWLADSSSVKQKRDIEKYDKANALDRKIDDLRAHIISNLVGDDLKRRKVASVSYLIDALKLRVGDEKDKDEADTVGATTLRPEHIKIHESGRVVFDFLGKDSVHWHKEVELPEQVVENLKEFMTNVHSSLFEGVGSDRVNDFLSEVVPGLSAKVFRTYHASKVVGDFLSTAKVSKDDPEYVKKNVAAMANLEAAIVCNHKRKLPKNWESSLAKKMERLKVLQTRKTKKSAEAVKAAKMRIRTMKATRDYNLGTSLRSYIDPRLYYRWGNKVGFDWKLYYPKTLQRKFSWVEKS